MMHQFDIVFLPWLEDTEITIDTKPTSCPAHPNLDHHEETLRIRDYNDTKRSKHQPKFPCHRADDSEKKHAFTRVNAQIPLAGTEFFKRSARARRAALSILYRELETLEMSKRCAVMMLSPIFLGIRRAGKKTKILFLVATSLILPGIKSPEGLWIRNFLETKSFLARCYSR